ncbi:MAG: NAD-dependent epimerase/dehydratase family protein [Rhodospirillales bacterium]|jgi:UDP-glucose 4-epimerase
MKVLVFGGAGFLGSYVVDELITRMHDVTIYDLKTSLYTNVNATIIVGDIMDVEAVKAAIKGHDAVYNFAGLADLNDSIDKPVETVTLNVIGNLNILEAARLAGVKRYLYASSVYVFSQKGAFYGASKKSSELIVEQYGEQYDIDYTIVRYGSVYGERANSNNRIYRILREALTEHKITFKGNGLEEREYVHGRDAGKLSVDVLEDNKYCNQNVILTGIERFRYSDLLGFVKEMLNNEVSVEMLDQDYEGHYTLTPYSFSPSIGVKLVNNPSVDFGQGLLQCINHVFNELQEEGLVDAMPVPPEYSE